MLSSSVSQKHYLGQIFYFMFKLSSFQLLSVQNLCRNGITFETTLILPRCDDLMVLLYERVDKALLETMLQYEVFLEGRFLIIKLNPPSLSNTNLAILQPFELKYTEWKQCLPYLLRKRSK